MGELESDIKHIIDSISNYINGNVSEENYEVALEVVNGLHEYIKVIRKNKWRATFVFLVSKIATLVTSPLLIKEDLYKEVMESCKMDYNLYLDSSKKLKRYIKECESRDEYPDLDAAYLLSINLSLVFRACMEYTCYIRTLENCYRNNITFQTDIKSNGAIEKEEVKRLIMVTDAAIEELKQRED